MRKIPTLYVRDFEHDPRNLTREVHPDCKWVIDGEGIATRKYDGTCVMYAQDGWWVRREVKPGGTPPETFLEIEHDEETGKTVGWADANESGFVKYLAEALEGAGPFPYGTYELCGPKVNRNPEGFERHTLIAHAAAEVLDPPQDFDGLAAWLHAHPYEGVVWHHPDGRMAKLKARDFPR
jgi:hypothetical protein